MRVLAFSINYYLRRVLGGGFISQCPHDKQRSMVRLMTRPTAVKTRSAAVRNANTRAIEERCGEATNAKTRATVERCGEERQYPCSRGALR